MNFLKRIFFKPFFLGHQEKEKTIVTGGQTLSFLLPEAFRNDFEVRKLQEQKNRMETPLPKKKKTGSPNRSKRKREMILF
jgi:hypothetical protein